MSVNFPVQFGRPISSESGRFVCVLPATSELVLVLEEAPQLADDSDEVDDGDQTQNVRHGAESFGGSRVTDVDIAVSGQGDRQPNRSRVEYRR